MAVVGVVAEYNPMHLGHLRHLALIRSLCPDAPVVVCLSGNWVQRGDCAVTDKWTRARWAVASGAQLVLEHPTASALRSAEGFARGAVSILAAAGCTHLSFGCEDPRLPALTALARAADSPGFSHALRPFLDRGLSFPRARQLALGALVGDAADLLAPDRPNNRLAVEYLRAMPAGMTPLPVPRTGVHDGPLDPAAPAAAPLRELLRAGRAAQAAPCLAQPWEGPVYDLRRLEPAVLSALRAADVRALEALPDGGDGAGRRLWTAAREAPSLEALYDAAQTRRLTRSRLRRLALRHFLDLPARPGDAPGYLRVLALDGVGARLLADLRKTSPLPVITKPAACRELLADEARRTDLFSLCAPQPLPCGAEFSHSPFKAP